MDPVSNANRIAMLLRQRLQERARPAPAGAGSRRETGNAAAPGRGGAVRAAALEELDDRKLKRALVESILADQLGGGLVNDAHFQQIVDRVTEAIEGDEGGTKVLAQVIGDLRAGR
jgi:hypothetical protein